MPKRETQSGWVYHVDGDGTNQDTLLCCRVWSESRAVRKPRPRSRPHTSWYASWSPAHRSRSTDSMTTTPPTAHALQTTHGHDAQTHTHDVGMRNERGRGGGGRGMEHPVAGRRVERNKRLNEHEHIP